MAHRPRIKYSPAQKAEVDKCRASVCIWTPPRLQVTCQWQLARLHTYIRPLQVAYDDAGP